jgi:hypothetical protein
MISGILFEISFYGTPENSKKFFDDMAETVRRIEAGEEDLYEMERDENGEITFNKIEKDLDDDEDDDLNLDCGCGGNCECTD